MLDKAAARYYAGRAGPASSVGRSAAVPSVASSNWGETLVADYSTSIVNAAVEQIGEYAQSGLVRWTNASAAIEAGTYTADNLVSDSLFLWTAGIATWWTFPFKILLRQRPLILFQLAAGATGDTKETEVLAPNVGVPVSSTLVRIGGAQVIPAAKVVPTLNAARTKLTIALGSPVPGPLALTPAETAAGFVYTGDIVIGTEQLVNVRVVVT